MLRHIKLDEPSYFYCSRLFLLNERDELLNPPPH